MLVDHGCCACCLRLDGGGEDRAWLVLQELQPGRDIRSIIGPRLVRDSEVREQERCGQPGGRFLHRNRVLSPLAAEIAVETLSRAAGMGCLVNMGGVEGVPPYDASCRTLIGGRRGSGLLTRLPLFTRLPMT